MMVAGLRVHQDDLEPLLAQRLAGLGARVVELAGLADDDRPGADEQDLPDVGPLRHAALLRRPIQTRRRSDVSRRGLLRAGRARRRGGRCRPTTDLAVPQAARRARSCACRRAR